MMRSLLSPGAAAGGKAIVGGFSADQSFSVDGIGEAFAAGS